MNATRGGVRKPLFFFLLLLALNPTFTFAQTPARIVAPVDNAVRVTLSGNVHPLARPEFDRGAAPPDLPLNRILLVLARDPQQEAALQKLLIAQQDKTSPDYKHWLTPAQFGQQFGPADSDLEIVKAWLQQNGFGNIHVSQGRTFIEFSGTAASVERAFETSIHKYSVNGEDHWANAANPTIPAALAPVVSGVLTLHNLHKRPQIHLSETVATAKVLAGSKPQFTSSTGAHALVPGDYYTIYNFNPMTIATSARIAVVGRCNIDVQDVAYFHSYTGDDAYPPQVTVNGTDPGDLGGDEEAEAVLDTTWAGAIAPTASVNLVVSQSTATTDGADLSALYIVDNNLADVMSESFSRCEGNATSAEAAGISSLAEQAATQGITYVVAAGDSGSVGCDEATDTTSTQGLSVNVLAATPYTVAVGGTMFNDNANPTTYWKTTNAQSTLESAISYIPENAWNQSCAAGQTGCTVASLWAGGGGASTFFQQPPWQTGVTGIPTGNARLVPDVALAAASHDPYLICLRGSCVPNAQGEISFAEAAGTSAATPAFAGIMALVGQKHLVRLGQPNFVLYRLAAAENLSQCNASSSTLPASSCVFNDVTAGNNAVPGETNYGTASATYQAAKGYDEATGLGSVNVTNLINQWDTVSFTPTSTTFSISPSTAVHGSPLNVTVSVAPNTGTGTPSGSVWLTQNGYPQGNFVGDDTADIFTLNSQGTFTGVTHLLPGGYYQVNAHYVGDGTYAPSDSTPPVQVNIQPESTTTTLSVWTGSGGNLVPFTSGPYGTPIYFQAQVAWQSGYGTPTSYVSFGGNIGPSLGKANVDSKGNALTTAIQVPAGVNSATATYSGDNSFGYSASAPVNFTITPVATTTTLTVQQTPLPQLTVTVNATGSGNPPGGFVSLTSGSTTLFTDPVSPQTSSPGTVQAYEVFALNNLSPGQYNFVAHYLGDGNYTASDSSAVSLNLIADFSLSSQGTTSQTVPAGQVATYANAVAVAPLNGYTGTVKLSCSLAAPATTCAVDPSSFGVTTGTGLAAVTVSTTARSSLMVGNPLPPLLPILAILQASALCAILCFLALHLRRPFPIRYARVGAFLLFVLATALAVHGCGGGGSGSGSSGGGTPPASGTTAGTYTITVTGVSGSTTHTTTLTLIVQ